jgi:cyclopropane-fatty-acyl-phospholipid synthase
VLNHGISRPWKKGSGASGARPSSTAYVFPDGELHGVAPGVSRDAAARPRGAPRRRLREHYALTLRHWVANLEANWDEAVRVGRPCLGREGQRLYMAASALNFERVGIRSTALAVRPDGGASHMPLRPDWGA